MPACVRPPCCPRAAAHHPPISHPTLAGRSRRCTTPSTRWRCAPTGPRPGAGRPQRCCSWASPRRRQRRTSGACSWRRQRGGAAARRCVRACGRRRLRFRNSRRKPSSTRATSRGSPRPLHLHRLSQARPRQRHPSRVRPASIRPVHGRLTAQPLGPRRASLPPQPALPPLQQHLRQRQHPTSQPLRRHGARCSSRQLRQAQPWSGYSARCMLLRHCCSAQACSPAPLRASRQCHAVQRAARSRRQVWPTLPAACSLTRRARRLQAKASKMPPHAPQQAARPRLPQQRPSRPPASLAAPAWPAA